MKQEKKLKMLSINTYKKLRVNSDKENLKKTFNRTYTEGYLFGEDHGNITNISRPNNFGYPIGKITGSYRNMYEITLDQGEPLNQNDIIRIDHDGEDVNLSVVRLYNRADDLINGADDVCYIKIKEKLSPGDMVYKTKDYNYYRELESAPAGEFRRFPLDLKVYAYPDAKLVIDAEGFGMQYLMTIQRSWVLSRLAIEMEEMPRQYTKFKVETWVESAMQGITRCFQLQYP